jgi:cell wall-associated NlpC family hydrolase
VAEGYLGAPYQWGGRESLGLDCSGLVQQALAACGRAIPRDTDLQLAFFAAIEEADRRRGDLVFWRGHVAVLLDADTILHANAHHMAVAIEPLAQAVARVEAAGGGPVTGWRRP